MAKYNTIIIPQTGFANPPHRLTIHNVKSTDIRRAKQQNKVLPIIGGITIKTGNTQITPAQSENIVSAVKYAQDTNRPINCHITVNIGTPTPAYKYPEDYIIAIKSDILNYYKRYTRRHTQKSCFIWVMENPNASNPHLHILLHMPTGHYPIIKKKIQTRLTQKFNIDTTEYRGGKSRQVHFKKLNTLYYSTFAKSPVVGLVKYMLKGSAPPHNRFNTSSKNETLQILQEITTSYQGVFYCQRCGVSRNIDRKARILHAINISHDNENRQVSIKSATDIMTANIKKRHQQHQQARKQRLLKIKAKNKSTKDPP